jgi:hypothetical protein
MLEILTLVLALVFSGSSVPAQSGAANSAAGVTATGTQTTAADPPEGGGGTKPADPPEGGGGTGP